MADKKVNVHSHSLLKISAKFPHCHLIKCTRNMSHKVQIECGVGLLQSVPGRPDRMHTLSLGLRAELWSSSLDSS